MIKNKMFTVEINTLSKRIVKIIPALGKPIVINNKENKVSTLLYTDGIILDTKTRSYSVREYKYKEEVIKGDLILDVTEVKIEDPTFILEITLKNTWLEGKHVSGYFDVLDDTSIYIINPNDKEALRKAKATINHMKTDVNDIQSILELIMYKDDTYASYYEINKNVYSLKKLI